MKRPPDPVAKAQDAEDLKRLLQDLFKTQPLAVLATVSEGQPYTNLVAFAATEDLQCLVFATPRATRKFDNLTSNPKVAMTVDNRKNLISDFSEAAGVMAIGVAREVLGSERGALEAIYLQKHPNLKDFVASPSCAVIEVKVRKYDIVQQFQKVVVLDFENRRGPLSRE